MRTPFSTFIPSLSLMSQIIPSIKSKILKAILSYLKMVKAKSLLKHQLSQNSLFQIKNGLVLDNDSHIKTLRVVLRKRKEQIGVLKVTKQLPEFAFVHPLKIHEIDNKGIMHIE
jgi:hypothetical protein